MDLDDLVVPEGKKALFVIHEENMKEAENPDDYDKCKFLETRYHRRVLKSDIKILEQYPVIIISKEDKKLGYYIGEKKQIPEDANALMDVGETKDPHKCVAQYCKFNDDYPGYVAPSVVTEKKKKNWFFPLGLFLSPQFNYKFSK